VGALYLVVTIGQDRFLLAEITFALEYELILNILDLNVIRYIVHVSDEFHKVIRWQSYDIVECRGVNVHVLTIQINQIQFVCRLCVFFVVFYANTEVVHVIFFHIQRKSVVTVYCFYKFLEVNHVYTNYCLLLAMEILEFVRIQFHVN